MQVKLISKTIFHIADWEELMLLISLLNPLFAPVHMCSYNFVFLLSIFFIIDNPKSLTAISVLPFLKIFYRSIQCDACRNKKNRDLVILYIRRHPSFTSSVILLHV